MISEERLEELLKTNSTIYTIYGGYVSKIELLFGSDRIEKNHLVELGVNNWGNTHTSYTFDMLFEDRLEAEEFLKYGNVTRTEKLELPTWEQVEKFIEQMKHFNLNHDNRVLSRIVTKDSIYYLKLCKDLYTFYFELKQTYIGDDLCEQISDKFPAILGKVNKENFNKARDIAVKLFKGEEVWK